MTGSNPRRRRGGSIRGEASSEPLGLDPAADQAAADAAGAAGAAGVPAAEDAVGAAEPFDETAPIGTSGRALVPMVDPHGEPTDVIRDVPEMSVEDVERRIGTRTRERRRRVAAVAPATTRVAANRRVILWRDSATILIFVVVALLAARFLLPSENSTATATASPTESEVAIGSIPEQTGLVFSAPPTIGGVVPSNLNLNATPTPPPLITLPPPTPTPVPTPTLKPGQTPKPTPKPSPSHSAPPTTPPPPIAAFSDDCPVAAGVAANFTDGSSGSIDSWDWDFGGDGTSTAQNPTHTFAAPGDYSVKLTVTGPGGSDSQTIICSVT